MRSRTRLVVVAAAALFPALSIADRTVKTINSCSYPVWAAVSPFSDNSEAYTDDLAWELTAGSSKSVTVPETFQGRFWGRLGCTEADDGTFNCITGACDAATFECGDGELGVATALELRLSYSNNGQYDVYDLMNGAGWSMPVSVAPSTDGSTSITCSPTVSSCPDSSLIIADEDGAIWGCKSACYGGLGDSAVQCCSGDYASTDACTSDLIDYYSYFKTPCESSWAYFEDSGSSGTTAEFLVASSDSPGYTLTFCPDGDNGDTAAGSSTNTTATGTATAASLATNAETAVATTQTATAATDGTATTGTSTDTATATSASSSSSSSALTNSTSTSSSSSSSSSAAATSATASTAKAVAAASAATGSPTIASATSAAAEADATSDDSDDSSTSSMSTTTIAAIGVGAVVLLGAVVGIIACVIHRKNKQQASAAGDNVEAPTSRTASIAAVTADASKGGSGSNPAQSYNALGHRSSRRSRNALLSESSAASSSEDISMSSDEEAYRKRQARRAKSLGSRRSSQSSRR